MATVANGGGASDAYNDGPPITSQTTEMNAIARNALTHQHVPSNPNYLDDPDGDFFDFPDIEMLLQNILDPVPQANQQNANCPGNQWSDISI